MADISGAINGTKVIIQDAVGEIIGQMTATLTIGGTPIDISNKANGDYITLLDGELAGKQLVWSGEIIYNDGAQYAAMRAAALAGTQASYTITYVSANTTDEEFSFTGVPNGMSDSLPHGDKVSTSVTISSSGSFTHTPAVA